MKYLCCVVLLTVGAVVRAQQDEDYWQGDYDSFYDNFYNDGDGSIDNTELKPAEISRPEDAELQDVQPIAEPNDPEGKELDVMEDYQIEDNRSNSVEKEAVEEHKNIAAEDPKPNEAQKARIDEDLALVPFEKFDENNAAEQNDEGNLALGEQPVEEFTIKKESLEKLLKQSDIEKIIEETEKLLGESDDSFEPIEYERIYSDEIQKQEKSGKDSFQENNDKVEEDTVEKGYADLNDEGPPGLDYEEWRAFINNDDVTSKPVSNLEYNKDILEETKNVSGEDFGVFHEQPVDVFTVKTESSKILYEQSDKDKSIEKTNKLLRESDDSFEPSEYENSDEIQEENNDEAEEDTPEKVYADLNADLDKLFATLEKLSDDDSEDKVSAEEETNEDNVQDFEEKYGKPFKEDIVLSWRDAEADAEANEEDENADKNNDQADADSDEYENLDDSNLSEIFKEFDDGKTVENGNASNENDELDSLTTDKNGTVEENVTNEKNETVKEPVEKLDASKEIFDYISNFGESVEIESNPDDDLQTVIKQILDSQPYGNDALIDEKQPKNEDAAEFEPIEANSTKVEENIEQKTVMVDDLSSAELSDVMTQFAAAHSEDLDVHSENFAKHIAPIHITLSVDEPTVITSPNYPDPYPTNNIVDWIFEGPGTGIELNITNFAVNGAIGDYLLVKPGGLDESGTDGLIFSYRLNSERKYRFTDVNKMFVRFEAKPGWQFLNGFSFSVKMIWPLPELEDDLPEPEPVLQPPQETLTLNLAGVTLPRFNEIKHEFLELVADMAKAYIRDNGIDQGLNTTLEVSQITRTAVCNIRWPNYETCVEVTFGVPLHYDEESEPRLSAEELDDMWTTYIIREQFASRLQSMGITEYAIPNDSTVLMVWLVIAAGVLISMAMLAFALWRFSCFEDYTRMQAYGDADSIQNEKRNLDLYPTPHQTLPPLYTENDYKWADDKYDDSTRVDIGGFANKSYVRDELFDLDSDEDVITTRDRKGVISPRDFYDV